MQFRLDDDDALSSDAVPRLRRLADRMADLPEFGISMANGLSVAVYPDRPVIPLRHDLPFLGAGLAIGYAMPAKAAIWDTKKSTPLFRHFMPCRPKA
mgnify:CR=1 FL=1